SHHLRGHDPDPQDDAGRARTRVPEAERMSDSQRLVELEDGGVLNVVEIGNGYPVIVLHGGPGLDHHMFRPWLDPLGEQGLRLILVDMRGQGGAPRVDPETLSVTVFAQDVDRLARAMELESFEPASMRDQIRKSWDDEATVETVAQARELMAAQWPFHFWEMGDAYRTFTERDDVIYSPEVLRHFAANGYGDFEWVDHLRWISKPMLILTGRFERTCSVAQAEEI